mmetsp:Transcript_28838/g.88220  ORF Transcript_28838/g.88220 Transcript_28838/m.88220 type:complete len:272 (+) Transcript_28838:558-1373(+)
MAGRGHGYAVVELGGQCRDYVNERNDVAGVRPELVAGGGLNRTDDNNGRKDPDGGINVADFRDPRSPPRFMFEVDVQSNSPGGIADRAVELFRRFGLLRALLQVKFDPRRQSEDEGTPGMMDDEKRPGRVPAVCWFTRRGLDGVPRVERVFEMGTAPQQVTTDSKRAIRASWSDARFTVDADIADGLHSINIEAYPDTPDPFLFTVDHLSLPLSLSDPRLQEHFKITVPEIDLYFGCDDVLRPAGSQTKDLVLDLYEVLRATNQSWTPDLS